MTPLPCPALPLSQELVALTQSADADDVVPALHAMASVMGKEMLFRATAVQVCACLRAGMWAAASAGCNAPTQARGTGAATLDGYDVACLSSYPNPRPLSLPLHSLGRTQAGAMSALVPHIGSPSTRVVAAAAGALRAIMEGQAAYVPKVGRWGGKMVTAQVSWCCVLSCRPLVGLTDFWL